METQAHRSDESKPEPKRFVIGVRPTDGVRSELCDPGELRLRVGDQVIAQTQAGVQIGVIASNKIIDYRKKQPGCKTGKVLRIANANDLQTQRKKEELEYKAKSFCIDKITELKLPMSLSRVVHEPNEKKTIFFFTAEGRVDFRQLIKELASFLRHRIEMRQVGVRDEARAISGTGICGEELCCTRFLKDFNPVTIRMAKDQGLALNPGKISGVCGRLMCCLQYEHEVYRNLSKSMPKIGKKVETPSGPGKVIKNEILNQFVVVRLDDDSVLSFPSDEVHTAKPRPSSDKPA
ncbi:MAG: sporulation protein [Candidatus Nitrohelix vancouverensis]|uniref:Sporulation protein n=1 Tax=Candidatus Nitrohelix vancouverensis TaxID=2705534 RepID=A0A7T0C5R3_9BACT|nr:MAG: sporulation protein [Candidatus Nitrohelix vancouverensis]